MGDAGGLEVSPVGCTPGRVEACPCNGSAAGGSQECQRDGTFGACVCPDAGALDAPEPADASAVADVREVGADVASPPDAAPDGPVDAPGDAPADAGDPLLDQVTAVRVTATVDGMVWTPDPSPRCEVNSGELSLTAGFSRGSIGARGSVPSMMGVGATAVLTLNERGAAEVDAPRATLTRGPYYGAGGERRMNLRLRGMPGGVGGPLVDVIALGCVVR